MNEDETAVSKKKTVPKSKTKLTAKKKSAPQAEISETKKNVHKKKKVSPDTEAPKKKKKASPDAETPKKKKKTSPDAETPKKKKKTSPDAEIPKKKRKISPDTETPERKSALLKPDSAEEKAVIPPDVPVKKHAPEKTHKKKKFRLKKGVKIVLFMFCAVCVFCGVIAVKNTRPKPVEADTTLEEESSETETIPETTEEPTTEEITEEPTTEIDENAPFIDYELEIDPDKPMIALTYDDGPSPEGSTAQILDLLEEYHAHATFFVVGKNITPETEELLQRQVELGCEVANHSWEHDNLEKLSLEDALESLKKCDDAVYKVIKRYPQHVRPPYGAYTDELREEDGRMFIYWSLDTSDWKWKNAKKDYEILMDNVGDGDIILMHDIHQQSADASERIIPDLIEMGYQLVTVSELMYYRDFPEENGMLLFNVHPDEPLFKSLYGTVYQKETEEDASEDTSDKSDSDTEEENLEDEQPETETSEFDTDSSDEESDGEN